MNKTVNVFKDDQMPALKEVKKMTGYYKKHALNLEFPDPPETPSIIDQVELPGM